MKPGDKVWIFDNDQFKMVDYIQICGKDYLMDNDNPYHYFPDCWDANKKPHFPTREALCEHYRKIFE